MTADNDLWKAADEARPRSNVYFAEVVFDLWKCALVKGEGRVPYDSAAHKGGALTAIEISLTPLPSRGLDFTVDRNMIAEFSQWTDYTLPSIKALGLSLRELNGKWVRYEMVESGRTWVGKDGETKHETVPVFLAVFDSLDEAETAAAAMFEGNGNSATEPMSLSGEGDSDPEKDTAAAFLPALWGQSKKDATTFAGLIEGNPLTAKFFTIASPEVIAVING